MNLMTHSLKDLSFARNVLAVGALVAVATPVVGLVVDATETVLLITGVILLFTQAMSCVKTSNALQVLESHLASASPTAEQSKS